MERLRRWLTPPRRLLAWFEGRVRGAHVDEGDDPLEGATPDELLMILAGAERWIELAMREEERRGTQHPAMRPGRLRRRAPGDALDPVAMTEVEVAEAVAAHVRHHLGGGRPLPIANARVEAVLGRYLELVTSVRPGPGGGWESR